MNAPSLLIQFDPVTWTPTIFINGETDLETAKLKTIADKIQANIERPEDET